MIRRWSRRTPLFGGKARRRYARDAAQGDEGLPPVIEPRVEVAERLPHHAFRRRHAQAPIMARSFAPCHLNHEICRFPVGQKTP